MKKLLYILFAITLFTSCSSDDDETTQDYTSFVFYHTEDVTFTNSVAAYKKDGKYYKIADLGNLSKDERSPEITLVDETIKDIYFFSDYFSSRLDAVYKIQSHTKNIFFIHKDTKGIRYEDKTDPTQYPQ